VELPHNSTSRLHDSLQKQPRQLRSGIRSFASLVANIFWAKQKQKQPNTQPHKLQHQLQLQQPQPHSYSQRSDTSYGGSAEMTSYMDIDMTRRNKKPRPLSEAERIKLDEYIDAIHYSGR
jgi:hypothetical protein